MKCHQRQIDLDMKQVAIGLWKEFIKENITTVANLWFA